MRSPNFIELYRGVQTLVWVCVDDDPAILSSLEMEIKEIVGNTYLIELAENGEDALEIYEELSSARHEIVLFISDYLMPKMTGDELLKQIQQRSPKTLKIMLTGQADLEAVGNAIKSRQSLVDNCDTIAASLSQLNIINHTLNEFGTASQRGELQYATFQLTSGVLNMYFFKVNQTSVAVGFISSTPEGLGLLLVHSKNNIDSIKNMLGDLL